MPSRLISGLMIFAELLLGETLHISLRAAEMARVIFDERAPCFTPISRRMDTYLPGYWHFELATATIAISPPRHTRARPSHI